MSVIQRPIYVEGKTFDALPDDLYIPPDYLEIFLEKFEGPLDLLLYLIRKRNFDLLNLPIVKITKQYLEYLSIMRKKNMDIATEYLVIAATLIQLKSRLLLPRKSDTGEHDESIDPRAELAARLLAYEKTQEAAQHLDSYDRIDRDFSVFSLSVQTALPTRSFLCERTELALSYRKILYSAQISVEHKVQAEQMTVRQGMIYVLEQVEEKSIYFHDIVATLSSLQAVICCFSGLLELAKQRAVVITQHEPLGDIFIQIFDGQQERA